MNKGNKPKDMKKDIATDKRDMLNRRNIVMDKRLMDKSPKSQLRKGD